MRNINLFLVVFFILTAHYLCAMQLEEMDFMENTGYEDLSRDFPLHFHAMEGDEAKVTEILKDWSINVNKQDSFGNTPLIVAVRNGRADIGRMLCAHGALVTMNNLSGKNALNYAIEMRSFACLDALFTILDKPTKVKVIREHILLWEETSNNVASSVALLAARQAHVGYVHILEALLEEFPIDQEFEAVVIKQLKVETKDEDFTSNKGWTLAHVACVLGNIEVIKLLVVRGANMLSPLDSGLTPFHLAVKKGNTEVVEYLIKKVSGCAYDFADGAQNLPLHLASGRCHVTLVAYLLDLGARVNSLDGQQRTALHWAADQGNYEVVLLLLSRGASTDISDMFKDTPLGCAQKKFKKDEPRYDHFKKTMQILTQVMGVEIPQLKENK